MLRSFCAATAAVTTLACSQGNQTLYIASDRPEALSVKIDGKQQEIPLRTFQAYSRVKLTKGAEIVVESNGAKVDQLELPPIEEGNSAIVFVSGAPSFKLVDYKSLGNIGKGSSKNDMKVLTGIAPTDIDVAPLDTSKRYVTFDQRAVVAGPDSPMPAGGSVNQFTQEKFPIYRIERVPPGADTFETIKTRVNTELGYGKLPGTGR
jgi:hypothetical protein